MNKKALGLQSENVGNLLLTFSLIEYTYHYLIMGNCPLES